MNVYETYVRTVAGYACADRRDPLREVILDRLLGRATTVDGLAAPPVGRDEADPALVLKNVFDRLERGGEDAAIRHFRETVVDLVLERLHDSYEPTLFGLLGTLVAHCGVAGDRNARLRLDGGLWGWLLNRLPSEFTKVVDGELPEAEDERARMVFDLWLAITDPVTRSPDHRPREHVVERLKEAFNMASERLWAGRSTRSAAYWTILLFRAVAKLDPEAAGCELLPRLMARLGEAEAEVSRDSEREFRDEAAALFWEYAQVFETERGWAGAFLAGVEKAVSAPCAGRRIEPEDFKERVEEWWLPYAAEGFAAELRRALSAPVDDQPPPARTHPHVKASPPRSAARPA